MGVAAVGVAGVPPAHAEAGASHAELGRSGGGLITINSSPPSNRMMIDMLATDKRARLGLKCGRKRKRRGQDGTHRQPPREARGHVGHCG